MVRLINLVNKLLFKNRELFCRTLDKMVGIKNEEKKRVIRRDYGKYMK